MAVDVDSLLDPLLVATGGAARLAPILSAAKMDSVIGFRAEQLQNAMLKRWLDSGKPIDDVFNFLQLLDLGKRGITSENLDTFAQYIDLYNNKYGKEEYMLPFLRKTFTDKVFAMMILEGTGTSKNIRDGYVWRRMGDGKSAVDFVASILFFAIDLDSLLDPLLAAFGGAAKLMPVLLKTKMNPVTGFRARQLYIVMLKRWLHSGKSVGNVIGLLEMNNLKIDDISRAEDDILEQYGAGSDTLKEYIKLYHEKHGTDMDLASCVEAEKIEKALANERGKRKGETQKRKGVSQPATIRAVRQKRLG
ncbi:unnamed protein product [Hyaloperonospora brassicae]|uniref:RxLR effector candidate protein n=1 Tax=Hyaloperonospora brassicae TaxID=162125 RepID=A0AAV0TXE6_HYABA|nr:unnamed protein product [Hyaloperonospora brassicae]